MTSNLNTSDAAAGNGDSGKTPSFTGIPLSSAGLESFMVELANATQQDINLAALTKSILHVASGQIPGDH